MPRVEITRELARFVACTSTDAIGEAARERARRAVVDTLGVMLAGSREEAARAVTALVARDGGCEEATVLGASIRAPAAASALANGTACHALDYDDVTVNMRGHPSAPLFPALLALSEKLGCSGRELLDAFVLGFEVECKLGRAIGEPHYSLGWHATSTLGTIGAAAACSRLMRLDQERSRAAIAIAASLASGLQQNFGTMTKPLHAGWAAHNGIRAATLAQEGLTADAQALEGASGFLRAMSGGAVVDPSAAVHGLGDPWEIISPGIGVKLYPCCYATHRAIDAAREVRDKLTDEELTGIEVTVSPGTLLPLIRRMPETSLEAKFSLEYCVAEALLEGRVNLESFAGDRASRPAVRRLMERVRVKEDGPPAQFPIGGVAEVRAWTPGGATTAARVEIPRGDPLNPLSWEELCTKFRECASRALPPERIEPLLSLVAQIDDMADVRELTAAAG
jgi:2-methylcitrate dehydratase PrpD